MFKRLILTVLVLGFSVSLFSQVNPDSLPEKYVKKVIIDAKWGDGPGEFGINISSDPIIAPGGISIDNNGDIYIMDNANGRIQRFNREGNLLNIFKVSCYGLIFGVRDGIIYAGGSIPNTLAIINVKSGKEVLTKISIPGARSWVESVPYGYVKDGELIIEQGAVDLKTKRWKFNRINKDLATFTELSYSSVKRMEKSITIRGEQGKEITIKKGTNPLEIDNGGNYYFEIWWSYDASRIVKISPEGKLLSIISLPMKNLIISDYIPQNPVITPSGDIYYLYPTGELRIENWKIHFIPGQVQVIKWELER